MRARGGYCLCETSSPSSALRLACSSATLSSSSGSLIAVEITYLPLAHLPRSIRRQRSLQKGKFSFSRSTRVRQVGQRSDGVFFRGIANLDDVILTDDARYQIVIVRFGDLAAVKRAGHKFIVVAEVVDEQLAVDLRGVHLRPPLPEQLGLL